MSAERTLRVVRDAEPQTLLTVEEAAKRLRIGRTLTYQLIRAGHLPTVKFAGSRVVRVSSRAVDEYIARGGVQ